MKPADFAYVAAPDAASAVAALALADGARLIAGGQALVPLLSRRAVRPTVLVDIGRAADTAGIDRAGDTLRIGATTPLRAVERSDLVRAAAPALAEAVALVGPPHVRARATIGGSLGHADPAAEIPAVLLAYGAVARVLGPAGERAVPVADLVVGRHQTALGGADVVTAVEIAVQRGAAGGAFREFATRQGDLPLAGVAALVRFDESGACAGVALAVCGVADRALLAGGAADVLLGRRALDARLLASAAGALRIDGITARPGPYATELVAVLAARALAAAWGSGGGARGQVA